MFAAIGFRLKHFRHSIYSFEPNYKNSQKGKLPGVVVCNHVSFLDIFILFMKEMSFLSKEAVGKAPIFGTFAVDRQCTFVNRDESKDKERVLEILKERAERASKGVISPLCVFPEGTVSNGRSLMKFKKGAFISDTPIKIMSLKWGEDTMFCPSIANINIVTAIVFTYCQPWTTLEIHELDEDFDPLYSYSKRQIKTRDEHSWEVVAEDVKSIMSFMTGYESSDQGFKELKICEVLQDGLVYGIEFGFVDRRSEKRPGILANNERKDWRVDKDGHLERILTK